MEALEQPDGLLPFRIGREAAAASIQAELEGLRHRIANFFDNNRIAYQVMQGVYLPFWFFDALLEVTETRTYMSSDRSDNLFNMRASMPATERNVFADAMNNVAVCAVKTPAPALTRRLGPFNMDEMVAYQPKLLAKYPAGLYTIDFDAASLEARSMISKAMRRKHEARIQKSEQMQVSISSIVQTMDFRLLLVPVWVVSMIEADDDTRAALVNGQSGEVILGKPQKRKRA
jgi:hypothetical protein